MELQNFEPLLQRDYGEELDCSLTCITMILHYFDKRDLPVGQIYSSVERQAHKCFYNGSKYGALPITIHTIFNLANEDLFMGLGRARSLYFKGVGFSMKTIEKNIAKGLPMILSLNNDGKNYYKNHSVVVVGCTNRYILVKDCWNKETKAIEYAKLSRMSSLMIFKNL